MVSLKLLGALGLLIFGMKMMSEALQKMAGPQLRHILGRMTTNRLTGMLTGTVVTCAVQSSSATTVMTVSFVSAGLLTLSQAISVIMGANIGTTATANLAALGANTQARRAALAHLLFNVFGVIWVLCVFYPFVDLVCSLVGYNPSTAGQTERLPVVLAMFHTCFNVTNTTLLIGLIPQMERMVCWLLPEKPEPEQEELRLKYLEGNLMHTPEIAVLQAQKETAHFAQQVQDMFSKVIQLFDEKITPRQHQQLTAMMTLCDDALTQMNTVMTGHRYEHDIRETYRIENDINQMRQRLKNENIRAIGAHDYDYASGTIFTDLINECEKLGDYVVNVVQARFGK